MTNVDPSVVLGQQVQLDDDVTIGPNCVIGSGVSIGAGTKLIANVVVGNDVQIGKCNELFPTCVIGGRPQILGSGEDTKFGGLVIGDGNTIREQVTIHPSMYPSRITKIGNDNLLMIGVHIGHDCVLEDKIVLSNFVQVSGHCNIQQGAWLSGMVLLHQFVTIGSWCYAAGMAGINHDVPPFMIISGHYPPKVRGVNKRGLVRAGFSHDQQELILKAYKKLYRNNGPLLENVKALAAEDGLDENVKAIIDTLLKSSQHRFGRYLETLRH